VLARGDVLGSAFVRSLLPAALGTAPAAPDLEHALADLERRMIVDALAATDDNKAAAAKRLGIGERTLWTKLKKHGI
jgi:two-component system response regulator AtoC